MNSRRTATSPIPKSFSLRNPNNGARTPAIFFSGDSCIRECALTSLHLPVFDEFVGNFFQESRRSLENIPIATGQAHVRITAIKFVLCARDRDVKQSPFFLQIFPFIHRTTARK